MAKAATQTTVTLKHLAATLAGSHEMAKKQSETILGDFVGLVVKHLKKGDRIRIGGLGILQVRKRAARMGRNPATGEPIKIKASGCVSWVWEFCKFAIAPPGWDATRRLVKQSRSRRVRRSRSAPPKSSRKRSDLQFRFELGVQYGLPGYPFRQPMLFWQVAGRVRLLERSGCPVV
jgi:DNA-binding protein HU-beta